MAVDSRISSKTYKTNVDELEPNDQNLKSELYEVSIFNHKLKIAPGLVIQEDNLSYCYVYAIKNNKVVKKIGVYEKIDDSSDIFDLSTFSEGSLCLFDVYEKNPSLVLEMEDTEEIKVKEDAFDFILTKINDEDPDKKVELTKKSYKEILVLLTAKKKDGDNENIRIITNLLNLIKKTIGDKKYYGEATQDKIKKYATDFKKRILSLIVSEPFLGLRFIFTKDGEPIDDSEFREWSIKNEVKEYVVVSENFEVIETYPADGLDEKYKSMSQVETPEEEAAEAEEVDEPFVKSKSKVMGTSLNGPETKSKATIAKGTSLNAQILPKPQTFKEEPLSPIIESDSKESKAESKAESKKKTKTKSETKAETKAETKEVDLNEVNLNEVDLNEPESKPKPKSKSKSKTTKTNTKEKEDESKVGYNLDLNAVNEPVKKSAARTPKRVSISDVELNESESKTEKKIKAPGPSIRPKTAQKK